MKPETLTRSAQPKSPTNGKPGSAGKKHAALLREMEELRARLEESEALVHAIQSGSVDAVIISGPDGEKVFALEGADYPYRAIVEVMNEGVVTLGADGDILSCNSSFASFLKMPTEKILGKPLVEFVVGEEVPKLRALLKEAARKGSVVTTTLLLEDGTATPVKLSACAFEVGGLPSLCIVVTDLTEMFAASETRLQLASIVETSNDAVVSESLNGTILTWNTAAERIYGFSAKEAVGRHISLILPHGRLEEAEIIGAKIRLGERIVGFETVHATKSRVLIRVSLTVSPLKDLSGSVTGVSIIARDITERKKAEAELEMHREHLEELVQQRTGELKAANAELKTRIIERKQTEWELRKSEERLRLALQAGRMGTWDWQIPTGDMTWSDEYYRMLGYEIGELKPSNEAWGSRVHPDDLENTVVAFNTAMKDGHEYSAEYRTCWQDGSVHWLWALCEFELDSQGQAVRSYGVVIEITERKKAELRIQELNDKLQEHVARVNAVNDELDSYSHSVSHDLRTPLRFMNRIAYLLLHEPGANLSKGASQKVNMIVQATGEMATLIENLLVFSQVGREPLRKRRVNLRKLFQEAVRELESAQENRSVEIVIQDLAPCQGDRTLLKEVVTNLLGNALKFTRRTEFARITIGCTESTSTPVYFVQDNGVGFEMSASESLFVAFHRLHKPEDFEGSGIGLALVKRIIDRHGGRIWATSEVNVGATFYFTFDEVTAG